MEWYFSFTQLLGHFWQKNSRKKPDKLCIVHLIVRLFTPDFSALSLYRRMERRGLSGYCITRRILSEHASIALKHLVKNRGASVHWLWVFLQAFCSLLTGSILCLCHIISCLPATELSDSVARSCEAFTATFAKNHGHFRSFHGQL